jgi:nucleoside triphosphate diphosphatase
MAENDDPVQRLLAIMARLRDPNDGCPWDLRQTYATIVPYTLEEAYEVADAIERDDMAELRDELGDLLFQIVFYARIAEEEGHFDFREVAAGICDKMVRRHPHVFGDARHVDDEALRAAWDAAKADERRERAAGGLEATVPRPGALDGVARALPALMRAEKLQRRAARVGFDWPDAQGAFAKTREEVAEVEAAWVAGDRDHLQEELGDLLFALVNVVRLAGFDAEATLATANTKFERRFREMEARLAAAGRTDLASLTLEELDAAWDAVKRGGDL